MKISIELSEYEDNYFRRIGIIKYNRKKSEWCMKTKDLIKVLNDPKTNITRQKD